MRLRTRLLAAIMPWTRRSAGHIFAFTPEQIGLVEGVRAAAAIAAMLTADLWFHIPDLAYGAVAAFWVCLSDPGGSDQSRLRGMLSFSIGATLAISIAAYCAHWGLVAGGIALFILVFLSGLTRSYGPTLGPGPTPFGLIAAIAAVIGVAGPRDAFDSLELAGCFLLGAMWAIALCLYIWRTDPCAPARRAVASIFVRLEDMTARLLRIDAAEHASPHQWSDFNAVYRRDVRLAIERGRGLVARLPSAHERFTRSIDAAGHVFAVLIALGHLRAQNSFEPQTERPLLDGLRLLLNRIVQLSDQAALPGLEAFEREGRTLLTEARDGKGLPAQAIAVAAEALVELPNRWQEARADVQAQAPNGKTTRGPWAIDRTVWRQALRVSIAVTVSYAIGAWLDVTFSYWGTIATLVLMQPLGSNTWLRIVERAVGSVVGGILTAILVSYVSGPWILVLCVVPLSAAVIALRLVNYGLFVVFLTPMFVLISDFIHPASHLVSIRALNEMIGAGIGLAASMLLWSEKEHETLSGAVLAAISANMAFASGIFRLATAAPGELDTLQRNAGLTSSRAEVASQRALLQGRSRSTHLDRIQEILVALRAICGAANVAILTRQLDQEAENPALATLYADLARRLEEQFKGGNPPGQADLTNEGESDLSKAIGDLATEIHRYSIEI